MNTFTRLLSSARAATLFAVCSFICFAGSAFTQDNSTQSGDKARQDNSERLGGPAKPSLRDYYLPADYENLLRKERNGDILRQGGAVPSRGTLDVLVNNNTGATGTSNFTQSEATILAFGSNVVVGFNDAGSNAGGANHITGFSISTDGGVTFTDRGTLPTSAMGDAGGPVMARDETTGRVYLSTLGFTANAIQMWVSDDNGLTWIAPVNVTLSANEDRQWHTVDNFAGAGNGNVYLVSRNFDVGGGINMYRSLDHGATFGPSRGVNIVAGAQGAFVAVGPDHSVGAFWWESSSGQRLRVRRSTDFGVTFAPAVTMATLSTTGPNGDLFLTGVRQGTTTPSIFRTNSFPHTAVNPVSGDIYLAYNDNPVGTDKADVFFKQSTDGGATWGAAVRVNDDATTTDQWQPTIAVTPDGAHLGIFYYSRQEDAPNNNLFKYYGRKGSISGSTVSFTPSFAISDVASLPEFGRDAVFPTTYMGDYNHPFVTPGFFHVVWSDNRDDLTGGSPRKDPNVYYRKIPALRGPFILADFSYHDFGSVVVNQTAGPVGLVIKNIGDADLTIRSISSPAPDFSTGGLPSLPLILPPSGGNAITVSFAPLSLGVQTSSFDITSDAINDPTFTVNLIGAGVVPTHAESPNPESQLPPEFTLAQNYPNPFNPSTTIRYGLPLRSHVTLAVFNTLGQQVAQLVNGDMEAGYHQVQFEGNGLSSGVYFYRIQAGDFVETKRLFLLK